MTARKPPFGGSRDSVDEHITLNDLFDKSVVGYYAARDAEDWSGLLEWTLVIDKIHNLAERLADR